MYKPSKIRWYFLVLEGETNHTRSVTKTKTVKILVNKNQKLGVVFKTIATIQIVRLTYRLFIVEWHTLHVVHLEHLTRNWFKFSLQEINAGKMHLFSHKLLILHMTNLRLLSVFQTGRWTKIQVILQLWTKQFNLYFKCFLIS